MDNQIESRDGESSSKLLEIRQNYKQMYLFAVISDGILLVISILLYLSGYRSVSEIGAICKLNESVSAIIAIFVVIILYIIKTIYWYKPMIREQNLRKEMGTAGKLPQSKNIFWLMVIVCLIAFYAYFYNQKIADSVVFYILLFGASFSIFLSILLRTNRQIKQI